MAKQSPQFVRKQEGRYKSNTKV